MSDAPSFVSSVAPSESISDVTGKKKNRPGKNARNAGRTMLTPPASAVTGPASVAAASQFASAAVSSPIPQPGKYPVVFQTGAGEPTQDEAFSYDHRKIKAIVEPLAQRYIYSARYAEFSTNAGYTDELFGMDIARYLLLSIAQQTVFAHVNMGLPLGDFSSVASTDVYHFSSLRAVISQFGEFSVPNLGTRFLLSDYSSTVSSLVFAAKQVDGSSDDKHVLDRMWLPMSKKDKRTKHIFATSLSKVFASHGLALNTDLLASAMFEDPSSAFNAAKELLPPGDRTLYDFLFQEYDTTADWVAAFTGAEPQRALTSLGLAWRRPNTAHLNFGFLTKVEFPDMVDRWARKRATITKFFSCGSSAASRSTALGSPSQLSNVSTTVAVTIVRVMVALSAPEFSLLSCFPVSGFGRLLDDYKVLVTTSIPVAVRATEFAQGDWL